MNHKNYYLNNENYAKFLNNQEPSFFDKYFEFLTSIPGAKKVLDVGCGTGQVVRKLEEKGFTPTGLEVSQANLDIASKFTSNCQNYDGDTIPFGENYFDITGSFNVLEHVESPEKFIKEIVRVTKPGGKVILSSPNFLRVIGFADYHPHMRSIGAKMRNAKRLIEKYGEIKAKKANITFDRMHPIERDNFQPDDDAIIATNLLEMIYHLKTNGCKIISAHCTDRKVPALIDWVLNASPLKYLMFNAFVTAEKISQ